MNTAVRAKPQMQSLGWAALMHAKGYRVLHRSGPFGRIVFHIKRGDECATFSQGQNTALNAELPEAVAADLREAGAIF